MRWVFSLGLVATVSCGTPQPGKGHDGGSGAQPDTSAADSVTTLDDASNADVLGFDASAGDASTSDTTLPVIPAGYECDVQQSGTVRVRTFTPNVALLIHDVFGTLVARTTSGSAGIVDLTVPGCGAVTAVWLFSPSWLFHTVTYVRGGDELYIAAPPDVGGPSYGPARTYIDNPVAGAASYFVLGPVASTLVSGEPSARDLYWSNSSLDAQGLATFAIHPTDSGSGEPAVDKYHVFENVSLLAAMQSPLHLTTWKSKTSTHQFRVVLPEALAIQNFTVANVAKGHKFWPRSAPPSSAAITHDLGIERSDYGDGLSVGFSLLGPTPGRWRGHGQVSPVSQSVEIDLTQALLPELVSMSITASSARPVVSWTVSAGAAVTPDITLLRMRGPLEWRFALPPGLTEYRLPELPQDLAVDMSSSTFSASLHEASDYGSYAVARARFVEIFIGGRKYPMGLVLRSSHYDGDSL